MADLPSIDQVAAQVNDQINAAKVAPKEKGNPDVKVVNKQEGAPVAGKPEAAPEAAAAPVETKVETKPDIDSAKFAALSRKEKEIRLKEQQLQNQQKEIEAKAKEREAETQRKVSELQEKLEKLTKGKRPFDVLQAAGYSYNDATMDALAQYKPKEPEPWEKSLTPVTEQLSKIEQENQALKKQLEEYNTQLKQQQNEQAYREFVQAVTKEIDSNNEKYEFVKKFGNEGIDMVRETMVKYYQDNGILPSYEEALQAVETYYESQADRFLSTKKFESKYKKPEAAPPKQASGEKKEPPKTLKASMGATGEATVNIDDLPRDEAIRMLAQRIHFKD